MLFRWKSRMSLGYTVARMILNRNRLCYTGGGNLDTGDCFSIRMAFWTTALTVLIAVNPGGLWSVFPALLLIFCKVQRANQPSLKIQKCFSVRTFAVICKIMQLKHANDLNQDEKSIRTDDQDHVQVTSFIKVFKSILMEGFGSLLWEYRAYMVILD